MLNRRFVPAELVRQDYDRLASAYDEYFSKHVAFASLEVVNRLGIGHDDIRVLDLACGTGTVTRQLSAATHNKAKICAIDSSEGMLLKAREKNRDNINIEFILGNINDELRKLPENSFDYVASGWAIGYTRPLEILRQINRVLKNGGKLGIIENKADTLMPIRKTVMRVLRKFPLQMQYLMGLPLRLPKDKEHLEKLLLKTGFRVQDSWEGEVKFHFNNGAGVLDWLMHTGASAGFDRVMRPEIKEKCDNAFIAFIEKYYMAETGIDIFHRFAASVAQKQ